MPSVESTERVAPTSAVAADTPWLERLRIRPFFQPIVDLSSGLPLGYEILSRGAAPFGSPDVMFRMAKDLDLLWDLERACRTAAIQKIASLPAPLRGSRFFLNVSPQVFSDSRFIEGLNLARYRANLGAWARGSSHRLFCLEMTKYA